MASVICSACLRNLESCEAFFAQCQQSNTILSIKEQQKEPPIEDTKIKEEEPPTTLECDPGADLECTAKPEIPFELPLNSSEHESEFNALIADEQEVSSLDFSVNAEHDPEEDVLNTEKMTAIEDIKTEKLPLLPKPKKLKPSLPGGSKKIKKEPSSMSMCDICGNSFRSARLYCHMRRHNNIKPHICE